MGLHFIRLEPYEQRSERAWELCHHKPESGRPDDLLRLTGLRVRSLPNGDPRPPAPDSGRNRPRPEGLVSKGFEARQDREQGGVAPQGRDLRKVAWQPAA